MKSFTGQKKRSRLQGHRKRRRIFEISTLPCEHKLNWIEYKTVRQYQAIGNVLDEFKVYGYRGGIEHIVEKDGVMTIGNGHKWLTE